MRLRLCFCIVLFLIAVSGHSQKDRKTDSLETLLKTGKLTVEEKSKVFYQLAKRYLYINEDLTYKLSDSAISFGQKVNNMGVVAEAYSLQGVVYKNKGEFQKAIDKHILALKIKESRQDSMGMAICYNDIGIIYKITKNYVKALSYYRKSNTLCRLINLGKGVAQTYNNIGTIHSETGNRDSSLVYYKKALEKAEEINDKAAISTACSNIGEYYGDSGKPEQALPYLERSLEIDKANQDLYGMILSYINLGITSFQLKKPEKGLEYYQLAEKICLENGEKPMLKDLYKSMAVSYENANDKAKAYDYLFKYNNIKDSLQTDEINKSILEVETKYQSERKDIEIAKNKAELKVKENEAYTKNLLIVGIIVLMILAVAVTTLYYRKNQLKQQAIVDAELAKQKDIRSKAIIEAEEKERIRIAKDLHDGVGQLLSAAKMNLSSVQDKIKLSNIDEQTTFKNALDLIDESVKEVRTVSHNMMPNTLLKMGLASAIREFVTKIQSTPNLKVNLEIVGLSERLEQEKESILYRVIQEIVSNIIKHSKASELSMQLIKHDKELTIMIEDNGVGFDTSKIASFDGIGLKNIQSRVEFINGLVHFDSEPGKGTRVIIDIPA